MTTVTMCGSMRFSEEMKRSDISYAVFVGFVIVYKSVLNEEE